MSDVEILKMTNDISNMESGFYCMEAGGLDAEGVWGWKFNCSSVPGIK